MKRVDGNGDVRIGWEGRLLGFRVVEESETHVVIRLPWWFPASWVPTVAEKLAASSAILDRGQGLSYRYANRLLRIERSA